jgi:hypothetical protein
MKKIFTLLLCCASSFMWSQLSCSSPVQLTNGFTQTGIVTPGTGSAPGSWVTSATLCGSAGQYHHNCFTTIGDDYVFAYTAGAQAGESVSFSIRTNINYIGLVAFTECNGTVFTGCRDWKYAPTQGATSTVVVTNLEAFQTVYFGVGIWSTPNELKFDVTNFTVTMPIAGVDGAQANSLKAFPNPVRDVLNLSYAQQIDTVEIINMLGQQVLKAKVNNTETQLNIQDLPAGNYFVRAKSGNDIQTEKIIKI